MMHFKLLLICLFIMLFNRSYSQDTVAQSSFRAIMKEFSINSLPVKSYAQLPACIIQYLNQKYNGTFRLSKHRFNASDAGGGPKRRLTYIAQLDNSYILSYEHGGIGYHCHSIIFETDGKDVINVIKLFSGVKHTSVTELVALIEIGNVFPFEQGDF